jgi:C4-dicarboxylate transporter DctM subunit
MTLTMLLIFVALLAFNFPIFICLGVASTLTLLFFVPSVPLDIVIQRLFSSIDKFALMAVPFFIFAANIMGRGGISRRLIDWIQSMVGSLRGGLALTTIASCEFFGAISGSSPATVVAVGSLVYPGLMKNGYGERFSIGLVTSTGAIAIIIPPSISMILYASVTNVSVGELFMAGILPGILFGICIAFYVLFYSYKNRILPSEHLNLREILRTTRKALWAIGAPAIILGGIYTGVFTPTESAAVAAVYGIFVTMVIYREMTLKVLMEIAIDSAKVTGMIFLIVAASGIVSWILAIGQAPQDLTAWIRGQNASPFMILILINLSLLIAGMFIDPNSAVLVLTPLFFPIIASAGIDPVHFGIIFVVNMAIGMYTPPFGLNLFVSGGIFHLPQKRIYEGVLPFIFWSIVALAIITYVPKITMLIPNIVYPK